MYRCLECGLCSFKVNLAKEDTGCDGAESMTEDVWAGGRREMKSGKAATVSKISVLLSKQSSFMLFSSRSKPLSYFFFLVLFNVGKVCPTPELFTLGSGKDVGLSVL